MEWQTLVTIGIVLLFFVVIDARLWRDDAWRRVRWRREAKLRNQTEERGRTASQKRRGTMTEVRAGSLL